MVVLSAGITLALMEASRRQFSLRDSIIQSSRFTRIKRWIRKSNLIICQLYMEQRCRRCCISPRRKKQSSQVLNDSRHFQIISSSTNLMRAKIRTTKPPVTSKRHIRISSRRKKRSSRTFSKQKMHSLDLFT